MQMERLQKTALSGTTQAAAQVPAPQGAEAVLSGKTEREPTPPTCLPSDRTCLVLLLLLLGIVFPTVQDVLEGFRSRLSPSTEHSASDTADA